MNWLLRFAALTFVSLCVSSLAQQVFAAPPNDRCALPETLQHEISTKYPGSIIVTSSDLNNDDRRLFQKEHGDDCPGVVKLDFYGDGKETLVLVLTAGEGANQRAELVLAHRVRENWRTKLLDTAPSSLPVAWRQEPRAYKDIENGKVIRAIHPVVVFCGYNSWAIVYAWTAKGIDKVWIAD
jgi:hypothetical protein